ncbi:MAG: IlvD/Edd family dehydratase [Bythopirellula sp.]
MKPSNPTDFPLRSDWWFNNPENPVMTAVYVERFLNYGITREELQEHRPIVGIAQIGSDLTPCNRIHLELVQRVRDGIRDAGGVPMVFPVHPLQESCRRPTAALDRNLAYLGLVEILYGYPLDAVVLTTGCDKTTPAALMAAATTNLPAIVLSGGPMLDGSFEGEPAGAGSIIWQVRERYAAGELAYDEFVEAMSGCSISTGHCNVMGTALSMNVLAEALGMSLPGCASIPAPYRERGQMAYSTGRRAVEIVFEDLTPSKILTPPAFENAIVVNTAIGGSTNCPPHLTAIARHMGVPLQLQDWQDLGFDVPLIANCKPAGEYLAEGFHRAGGARAVMAELLSAGRLHDDLLTISGKTIKENLAGVVSANRDVIRSVADPLQQQAGFQVLKGNLFDAALIKTCVISDSFRQRYLTEPGAENCFTSRAIVFEGPEDYQARINDASLQIDETCMLVVRGVGPIGYPGSAEVVNMLPPDALIQAGTSELPCLGDGRQSGTSACPAILNVAPEAAVGGGLSLLQTGDMIRVDLNLSRVDLLVDDTELQRRRELYEPSSLENATPWQQIHRESVGQLHTGACMDFATAFHNVCEACPRHNH